MAVKLYVGEFIALRCFRIDVNLVAGAVHVCEHVEIVRTFNERTVHSALRQILVLIYVVHSAFTLYLDVVRLVVFRLRFPACEHKIQSGFTDTVHKINLERSIILAAVHIFVPCGCTLLIVSIAVYYDVGKLALYVFYRHRQVRKALIYIVKDHIAVHNRLCLGIASRTAVSLDIGAALAIYGAMQNKSGSSRSVFFAHHPEVIVHRHGGALELDGTSHCLCFIVQVYLLDDIALGIGSEDSDTAAVHKTGLYARYVVGTFHEVYGLPAFGSCVLSLHIGFTALHGQIDEKFVFRHFRFISSLEHQFNTRFIHSITICIINHKSCRRLSSCF